MAVRGRPGLQALRRTNVPGLAFIVVLLGVWEALVSGHVLTYIYLPAPSGIASAGATLLSSGALPRDMAHTLEATLAGWVIGSIGGLALGMAVGMSSWLWRNSMATFEVLRALPAIAFVPAAVLLLGFSLKMEIVVAVYVTLWPVFLNTLNGVRAVTPTHEDIARMMRLSRREYVWKLVLPSAASPIIVGLRLGLALSLALAVVAEMVGNPAGVGYSLILQQQALQPSNMFAYIIAIGLVGMVLNTLFMAVVGKLFPGIVLVLGEESE